MSYRDINRCWENFFKDMVKLQFEEEAKQSLPDKR